MADNADQIAFWNSDAGLRWVGLQDRIDAMMAPMTEALIARAAPAHGERVLDIGCGFATTVLALARCVADTGHVLGVDVSRPMLDLGARRIADAGVGNVALLEADATTHAFAGGSIDLAVSRFGVMFFADPVAAFRNVRTALRDGGRLAFVCWRKLADNPHFVVPMAAARPHLPPQPAPDPTAPGMFAFADPDRVRRILSQAGFRDVALDAHDPVMIDAPAESAAEFALQMGPLTRALADAAPEQRAAAEQAVRAAMADIAVGGAVRLTGGVWLVSARV